MGTVKFGKIGGGEVIIKNRGGENLLKIGSGRTAHMYVPTYRQWTPPPPTPTHPKKKKIGNLFLPPRSYVYHFIAIR